MLSSFMVARPPRPGAIVARTRAQVKRFGTGASADGRAGALDTGSLEGGRQYVVRLHGGGGRVEAGPPLDPQADFDADRAVVADRPEGPQDVWVVELAIAGHHEFVVGLAATLVFDLDQHRVRSEQPHRLFDCDPLDREVVDVE